MIEGERDEAGPGEPFGVRPGDLVLDAGERPGEGDRRRRPGGGRQPQLADQVDAVAGKGDAFGRRRPSAGRVRHPARRCGQGSSSGPQPRRIRVGPDGRRRGRHGPEGTVECPCRGSGAERPGGSMVLVIPDVLEESCSTRQALERFAAKWRVLLIYALLAGPQRHAAAAPPPGGYQPEGADRDVARNGGRRARTAPSSQGERAAARRVRTHRPRAHAGETPRGDLRLGDQPAAFSVTAPGG